MAVQERFLTVEAFEQFVLLPENRNWLFEYIAGSVVEVVSNNYSSKIAANILAEMRMFIKGKNLGDVTGADGGYRVSGERYMPDVGFISRQSQQEPSHHAWNPLPPDLAVEVLSPTDNEKVMAIKVGNYLAAKTIVWLVSPLEQSIAVFVPNEPVKHFGIDAVWTGSFNFTTNATRSFENSVLISDKSIAQAYLDEYLYLYPFTES